MFQIIDECIMILIERYKCLQLMSLVQDLMHDMTSLKDDMQALKDENKDIRKQLEDVST